MRPRQDLLPLAGTVSADPSDAKIATRTLPDAKTDPLRRPDKTFATTRSAPTWWSRRPYLRGTSSRPTTKVGTPRSPTRTRRIPGRRALHLGRQVRQEPGRQGRRCEYDKYFIPNAMTVDMTRRPQVRQVPLPGRQDRPDTPARQDLRDDKIGPDLGGAEDRQVLLPGTQDLPRYRERENDPAESEPVEPWTLSNPEPRTPEPQVRRDPSMCEPLIREPYFII
jgi:hypothetical protein